jgi:ArsR family metal-binding transcriptional regulator
MHDVAGKAAEAQRELATEIQQCADENEETTEKEKHAAEFAKRLHREILPEVTCKAFQSGQCIIFNIKVLDILYNILVSVHR